MAVEAASVGARDRTKAVGVVLWGTILLALALGIGAVAFVQRYQPLVPGSLSGISRSTKSIETYGDTPVELLTPWQEGQTFFAGMTLRNDGPVAVTVRRVLTPDEFGHNGEPDEGFEPVKVVLAPPERFAGDRALEYEDYGDFVPFELAPGAERRIAIQYRLNGCVTRGQTFTHDSIPLRFSAWGMDRDVFVELPYRLVADARYRKGC